MCRLVCGHVLLDMSHSRVAMGRHPVRAQASRDVFDSLVVIRCNRWSAPVFGSRRGGRCVLDVGCLPDKATAVARQPQDAEYAHKTPTTLLHGSPCAASSKHKESMCRPQVLVVIRKGSGARELTHGLHVVERLKAVVEGIDEEQVAGPVPVAHPMRQRMIGQMQARRVPCIPTAACISKCLK